MARKQLGAAPSGPTDAATKAYVDANLSGGIAAKVEVFTSSATWTKDPLGKTVEVYASGSGGGGASGWRQASGTASRGGCGGGAGGTMSATYNASDLPGTVPISVGAPGSGGASVTVNGTTGASGTAGGAVSFGGVNDAFYFIVLGGNPGTASSAGLGGSGRVQGGSGIQSNTAGGTTTSPSINGINTSGGGAGAGLATTPANADGSKYLPTIISQSSAYTGSIGVGSTKTDAVSPTTRYAFEFTRFGGGGPGGWSNADGTAGPGANGFFGGGGGGGGGSLNGSSSGKGGDGGVGFVIIVTRY